MSADDFQTKYSSVMEAMLKSAVAETTKLFETMVDELKEEICRMKKENDDLKSRCSHFEKARHQSAVCSGETERLRGPSDGPRKRDRAVQCDLVPVHTALVEPCQPQMHPPVQKRNQQCVYDPKVSSLHDHTYGEANTRRASLFFKQEAIRKQQTARCTRRLDLNENAGFTQASICRTRSKGPLIYQNYSTCKRIFPKKIQDARITLERPCRRRESYLQGAQNQSIELQHSFTGSVKDNLQEAASQISEEQREILTPEKHTLGVAQHQSEVEPQRPVRSLRRQRIETSVIKQADVTQQQNTDVQSTEQAEPTPLGNGEECEKIKSGVAEHEACPGLVVPAQCRKGRQRKKTKPIGSSAAALLASLSERCSSEKQKLQDSQRLSKEMEGVPVQAPSPKRSSAILTPNTQTVQPRERRTSATLQDALLFVEAMNQSTVEETVSTPQRVAASCVVTLETVEEVPPEQQTPPPSVEMVEDTGNLPIAELSATTQSSIETVDDTSLTAEATPVSKTKPQINVVPKGLCTVTPSSTTTSSEPIATAKVQTLSIQQIHPLPTSAKATSPEIFSATRLLSSLRHIIGTQSPTQLPNAVSTVAAAQKQSIPPNSTTSPSSLPSVPQKMMYVMSSDLPPSVAPQSTATSSDTQSETPLRPQLTIIVPKGMSIIAPSEIVPDTMQQTVDSADPVTVSSLQLNSSTEESSVSLDTQTVSDETAAISPQKKDPMTDNLESPKQTAAVEPNEQKSEVCSSFDMPLVPTSVAPMVPQTTDQKLSPVVRLMRLPAQVLAQEEILVSTLFKIYSSQSQPIVLKDTTQENPSPTVESTQSSETTVLSIDSCPESKETLVDLDVYTFQMSEEPNEEEETSSISLNLEASPLREPSPSEPTSNFYEDISFEMQDCASQNDQPIEETPSTSLIQLTPIITKDDPHLQMTKAQFLAQLSVTPVSQDPQEASSNDSADVSASCAEQSTGKKRMPKKSRVAHLRSNLKTRLQARRKEGNPEPETSTENPEEHSLENDGPNNNALTTGPTFPSLNDPEEVEDVTSQNNTSKDADPVSSRKSGQREAVARPKKTVSEPTSVSSKILKVRGKSSPMGTRLGADGVVVKTKRSISSSPRRSAVKESPKNTRSSSVSPRSPRRSIAIKESLITKKIKSTSVTPRRSIAIKESPITKKTKSTSVSPRRSIAIKESLSIQKPKSTTVSPRRSVANKESPSIKKKKSTSVSPRRSIAIQESLSIQKKKSTSVSPRRSIASKESPSIKRTKSTSVSPRRSIAIKENPRTRKARSTSVSPRRSIAIKESPSTKKAKFSAVTPRRSPSTKQNASSKKTKSISVGPRKNISTGDGAPPKNPKHTSLSPKTTSSGVDAISKTTKSSPRTPSVQKKSTNPNVLTNESTFCRRRCTLNKTVSYSYQNQRESSSLADGASSKNIKNGSISPNVKCRKTRETPPAKKPRLYQDGTGLKQTSTAVDAKNLDKVAKANATPKTTRSSQSKLVFGAKIVQLAENHTVCENGRKITAKSVWTPPKMPPGKTPLTGRKEAVSPKSQEQPSVFPPSVSLTPIPVKGPPVVSPLQPLSVIGRRLLKNQCGECGRVLSSVAALESHVSLHAGRRPFSCTLCGKRFPDSKGLKRHGRVHRNGRIHVCQHCGKGFVYRFGLTKHLQMVHRKIKPFICQICNKGFFTKRDVEAHIRIHTGEKPFHCNLCEKKFARRVELNVHLRWHNGEKRHWCPFCGKGFLDFNNLKRHKFIHTGEKPHSCPHCPKNFTQSGHLKKHVKNVHKIL